MASLLIVVITSDISPTDTPTQKTHLSVKALYNFWGATTLRTTTFSIMTHKITKNNKRHSGILNIKLQWS